MWESIVFFVLCSEEIFFLGCVFGKVDMDKLLFKDFKLEKEEMFFGFAMGSNGVSVVMEFFFTLENNETFMEVNEGVSIFKDDKDGKKFKMFLVL